MANSKKIVYSEPADYLPKEIRDKYFNDGKSKKKPATAKKATTTKKKKTVKKK